MKHYTVVDESGIVSGTAQDILQRILSKPLDLAPDLKGLNVDQYADMLIKNASYYLSKRIADQFADVKFPSKFDQALSLLSAIPASGTHIVASEDESVGSLKEA